MGSRDAVTVGKTEAISFSRDVVNRFSVAIGDFNVLHRDDEVAQLFGLSRANVPGSLLAAYCLGRAERDGKAYREARIRFRKWVYVDESVRVEETSDTSWRIVSEDRGVLATVQFSQ